MLHLHFMQDEQDKSMKIKYPRKRIRLLRGSRKMGRLSWCYAPTSYLKELALQGLRGSKKLKPGALSLYIGNGQRARVEAIRIYHLRLPSGLVIVLNNFSKNNIVYFSAIPRDGIYEINLSSSNDSSMYVVSNKRAKLSLDSSLLWHCRLGHISKKCIEKLQHDGLLNSTDIESLGKCVSCMSGKIEEDTIKSSSSGKGKISTWINTHQLENQLGKTIKSLRSDRGGEYMSQQFLDHLKELGIIAHHTPPYTPQHIGVSKRGNRTLLDMVHSMMSQTTLPKSFWDYAFELRLALLIMVTTMRLKRPIQRYPKETIRYSFHYPPENKAFVARNAEFFESNLIDQEASGSLEDLEIIQEEDTNPSLDTNLNHEADDQEINEPQSDINPIRRSSRTRSAPDRMCLYVDAEEHELGDLGEPANYKAALWTPATKNCLIAMNVEMKQSCKKRSLDLVILPPNGKTVGSKWLFKKKTDMDGAIHTYKACLVVKGYTQTPGIDYEKAFSPVKDIRAIRILIAITVYYDYEI
ncbi:retrotransposon protein, putative, ty1-copia subclass [Tanacetum coccineum]